MKMAKAEVQKAFPGIFSKWRELPEYAEVDDQELHFFDFYNWLESNYPEATKFRSVMGPREDIELWFDEAAHQMWAR
jgi:hypothetical protein